MEAPPTCLTDPTALLVADASTIININASGDARGLIGVLPNRIGVIDIVRQELERGQRRQRHDADLLNGLIDSGLVEAVELDDTGAIYFEALVIGAAKMTLDDGEAATIAYAASKNGTALIDERKATRLAAMRFPSLQLACTLDLFTHPNVQSGFGRDRLAEAVFNALSKGRMRVFPHHVGWVVELIGADRVGACISLPNSVRKPQQRSTGEKGMGRSQDLVGND